MNKKTQGWTIDAGCDLDVEIKLYKTRGQMRTAYARVEDSVLASTDKACCVSRGGGGVSCTATFYFNEDAFSRRQAYHEAFHCVTRCAEAWDWKIYSEYHNEMLAILIEEVGETILEWVESHIY